MPSKNPKSIILVVDDAPDTLEVIKRNLESQKYKVFTASGVNQAINILESISVHLVITDYKMPEINGLDLVRHVNENYKTTEIIMITGYASIKGAIDAVKFGAQEYLPKPFTDKELLGAVKKALSRRKKNEKKNKKIVLRSPCGLIGESDKMQEVYKTISKIRNTTATVLITGESGTGKELVARAVHYNSDRMAYTFIPVNCGAVPEGLLERELFGHEKGAFTGANQTRAGFFQTAERGTIFLDEIGETSLSMQVKLLRVLQNKEISMIGSSKVKQIDIRIIAASNKNLFELVQKGSFREDLYYRLNIITIELPPLREREGDIPLLIQNFSQKFSKELSRKTPQFTDKALECFSKYSWPGNVRELENTIQRLIVMNEGKTIDIPDLPNIMRFSVSRENMTNRTLEEVEIEHIKYVLDSVNGNKTKASKILGIDRKTLREKIKKVDGRE